MIFRKHVCEQNEDRDLSPWASIFTVGSLYDTRLQTDIRDMSRRFDCGIKMIIKKRKHMPRFFVAADL